MLKSNFKVGQVVSFPSAGTVGDKARKGGTITKVETMYELKEENKRFYPNGKCRGELTTIKELSKGESKGFAYLTKTIQPNGYTSETVMVEEGKLSLSSKISVLDSYTLKA
jgi:hypothetical protein|tara:strand:+ start:553 stop:885 length:333 start_codon:yes stop_codon:yes gene_type:complete